MIENDDVEVVVVEVGGWFVGFGYVICKQLWYYVQFSEYVFIGFLYVDFEFCGQGINKQVLDYLFDWV